uniref:Uncharacterized protein n=1 Tax=Arundo donax TaxID=35708 RepID=A0A0A8ZRJ4_ARUDO
MVQKYQVRHQINHFGNLCPEFPFFLGKKVCQGINKKTKPVTPGWQFLCTMCNKEKA